MSFSFPGQLHFSSPIGKQTMISTKNVFGLLTCHPILCHLIFFVQHHLDLHHSLCQFHHLHSCYHNLCYHHYQIPLTLHHHYHCKKYKGFAVLFTEMFLYFGCHINDNYIICVVEYEKGSAHRKYVLRKLQNKQKSGSPYECRFFALLH